MTGKPEEERALPPWSMDAQIRHAYLDNMRYERGPASIPEGRPGLLSSRLHSSDESVKQMSGGEIAESPSLYVRLDLDLTGLHPDAETAEVSYDLVVFRAHLTYRAEYALAEGVPLPPEAERQVFIQRVVVPQLWLQIRHMADLVTAQSRTGRVVLPVSPPVSQ